MRDTRDTPFLGATGSFWKATQEIAGVGGGDAKHVKALTETAVSRALGSGHVRPLPLWRSSRALAPASLTHLSPTSRRSLRA